MVRLVAQGNTWKRLWIVCTRATRFPLLSSSGWWRNEYRDTMFDIYWRYSSDHRLYFPGFRRFLKIHDWFILVLIDTLKSVVWVFRMFVLFFLHPVIVHFNQGCHRCDQRQDLLVFRMYKVAPEKILLELRELFLEIFYWTVQGDILPSIPALSLEEQQTQPTIRTPIQRILHHVEARAWTASSSTLVILFIPFPNSLKRSG